MKPMIGALIAGLAFAGSLAFAQDKIELKASIFAPPTHGFMVDVLQAWAQEVGRQATAAKGVQVVAVSDAVREQWRAQFKPLIDQQIAETEKQGVPDARAVYDEMVKQVARFAKK